MVVTRGERSFTDSDFTQCTSIDSCNGWAVARNGTINHTHNGGELPMVYSLLQNYPNPFNPITTIRYQIPELSFVTLKVFDVLGGEIATLVNEEKPAGEYEVDFDATGLPSEIYFYKLKAGSFM